MQLYLRSKDTHFESNLTDAEVRVRLKTKRSTFAQELYAKQQWSEQQTAWAHYIAQEQPRLTFDFSPLLRTLRTAQSNGAKRISLRFKSFILKVTNNGNVAVLGHEIEYNRRFNCNTNVFHGYIGEDETTVKDTDTLEALKLAASDPLMAAIEYGQISGTCSCCGRKLTDDDSIRMGIGPVCAKKFGLT